MLSGNVGWSISYWNDNSIYFELNKVTFEEAYVEEEPFQVESTNDFLYIEGHGDEEYNGEYYKSNDWSGQNHFEKLDGTTHLYFYTDMWGDTYW